MASGKKLPEAWKVALISTARVAILGAIAALITKFSPIADDKVEMAVLVMVLKYVDKYLRVGGKIERGLTVFK